MDLQKRSTVKSLASLLSVGTLILAVSAVFLPWFRWSEHTWMTAHGRWLDTTNLNYLLPTMAVGTAEAIGAQMQDGQLALNIGRTARAVVLGISILSFWQLFRDRTGLYQLFIPGLLLFIFLCLFSYIVLNSLIIEQVILENIKTLPYIIGPEWSGPASLIGAMLLQAFALLAQRRGQIVSNGVQ